MSVFRRAVARPMPVLTIALIGVLAAACGSAASTPAPSLASPALPTAPVASEAAAGPIAVTATEYRFDPSTVTTASGRTTFVVTNAGTVEHEFEIFKGDQVVDEVEGIVPGLTRELAVDLAPGQYTFVCKLTGHEDAGMKGTLTVTG